MEITYTFFVDFARPQRTNELMVMQGDHKSRTAKFILMNNGKPLSIDEEYAVSVNALLPDESAITVEAALSRDEDDNQINEIIFPIPSAMTQAIGKSILTITVYKLSEGNTPTGQLSSFGFYVNTKNELYSASQDDDEDIAGLRDLMEKAADAIATVEQFAAQTALPNPFPLRITLEEETYDYNGSRQVNIDFGNVISRISDLETAFPAGCRQIAQAVTNNGVTTAENASPSTIATNIGQIRSGGSAAAGDVLTGKSAYVNKQLVNGSMPNQGKKTASLNCGQTYPIPAGYHNGQGVVTANSLASQTGVDTGKTAVTAEWMLTGYQGWVNGNKISGSMANQGAKTQALNCGQSYPIPKGFHNGSGKITANSLASQTAGTATAARILKGYTAWVGGQQLTGTYVAPAASGEKTFNAALNTGDILIDGGNGIGIKLNVNLNLKATVNGSNITLQTTGGSINVLAAMAVDESWQNYSSFDFSHSRLTIS